MPLDFSIDDTNFKREFKKRVVGMFPAARDALERSGSAFHKAFKSARLSGRKGTVGLHARTGALRAAFFYKVTGDRLDRIRLRVGWPERGKETMKAIVHEKGKVIKGKPWLVFRLIGPRGGDYGWKKVKRVYIPPRLEFRKHWRNFEPKAVESVKTAIRGIVERG
jgi:hypothetical protein